MVRIREDGREARLGAMPVQALAECGDRVVRQVEQWGAHVGVYVEEVAAHGAVAVAASASPCTSWA